MQGVVPALPDAWVGRFASRVGGLAVVGLFAAPVVGACQTADDYYRFEPPPRVEGQVLVQAFGNSRLVSITGVNRMNIADVDTDPLRIQLFVSHGGALWGVTLHCKRNDGCVSWTNSEGAAGQSAHIRAYFRTEAAARELVCRVITGRVVTIHYSPTESRGGREQRIGPGECGGSAPGATPPPGPAPTPPQPSSIPAPSPSPPPNVIRTPEGKFEPAPGYEWASSNVDDLSVRRIRERPTERPPVRPTGPPITSTWVEQLGDNIRYIWVSNDGESPLRITRFVFDECENGFPCHNNWMTERIISPGQADIVMTLFRMNTREPWRFKYRYWVEARP